VIFLGDFNYRIEMEKSEYKRAIEGRANNEGEMKYLGQLGNEQLSNQKQLANFLNQFEEGTITFPPTYKIGNQHNIKESTVASTTMIAFPAGPIASSTKKEVK
jgi:hypothetical protein